MFNYRNRDREKFFSNHPLPDKVVIVPAVDEDSGNFRNHIKHVPQDNHSELSGLIYNPDTMSLRAKLNMGVPMSQVAMPSIDDEKGQK